MELAFESKYLRDICEDMSKARFVLGDTVAEALTHRLADLHAAISISDLLVGNCRIEGIGGAQRAYIDLPHDHCIILTANHPKQPVTLQGDLDWNSVTRIKIILIGKNHEKK